METLIHSARLELLPIIELSEITLPLMVGISAGFPSPAADHIEADIDLIRLLVKNRDATYFGRVKGESMTDIGIDDGDILIVDRSLPYKDNCIAVCYLNQEFTVKRLLIDKGTCWLIAENGKYPPIEVNEERDEFVLWGVVTSVIKLFK
jgi:DNA polymerase V